MFAFRLPALLSTEELAHLALQEDPPRFDILASRLPSYDREHSSDHVLVANAEFLMYLPSDAPDLCLSYTDSDNVILQQETETTHVSKFQLLLCSQPVGLGLLVELLTRGVEHTADILPDARNFASEAFEVLPLQH